MIKPQLPKNEIQRLQALYNLNILDTLSEERFDRITRVIQHLFNVPIALVSFVDKEREWFKSKYGMQFRETPRDISFGGHVILQEEIMVVQDALKDDRFRDNPLVLGKPDIRFYLGCPLKIKGQFNIGTLCLIDHQFQQINDFDLDIIKNLATTIETEFDENHLSDYDELTKISNRQGFIVIGKQIIRRCNRFDKRILVLYFDLHHMKYINDTYGRDEGDTILKIFSEQLIKNFRKTDVVARLEGDKFCVLCSGMGNEHIPIVLNRLQKKLLSIQTKHPIEFNVGSIQYDRWRHNSIYTLIEESYEKIFKHKRHLL